MFPSQLTDGAKEIIAIGTVLVTVVAGYTGLQKDVASTKTEIAEQAAINEAQTAQIHADHDIVARVDERTKVMKEQLDRIEKQVGAR